MRIAQVSPLYERVPPLYYGGTERIVAFLTEELVRQGHEVTLFASGDSLTRARLRPIIPRALRLDGSYADPIAPHVVLVERVFQELAHFDVVHFHIDYLHYPLLRRQKTPALTTLHGRLDLPELRLLYAEFREVGVVSISNAQRRPLPWLNWLGTVYHGLPPEQHAFRDTPGQYLAFVSRLSPEKGAERAIAIARRAGLPLKLAGKVDAVDRAYFEAVVKPLLREPGVEYLGEISEAEKDALLGQAAALLFPITWPEPFGLVMIEAMACGTPVIAFPYGSVPEVIDDGVTGFVVPDVDAAVQAVARLDTLSRQRCRETFLARFTAARMAQDYLRLYARLLAGP
ncbi:MAG: glycosyl transferase [Candidatus Tectimicrobiota bacterium]|nr:MAG: glycosyl transferase [Candidatus Tectomicrobia bacterium]